MYTIFNTHQNSCIVKIISTILQMSKQIQTDNITRGHITVRRQDWD